MKALVYKEKGCLEFCERPVPQIQDGKDVIVEQEMASECIGADCSIIRYATPNGNDLMLETDKHVIQITANPGTPYTYYVWAGNKTTSDDPDMVVDQGTVMVLTDTPAE